MTTGTVTRIGSSRGVVLPVTVVGDDFPTGATVEIERLSTGEVLVRMVESPSDHKEGVLARLEAFLGSQPHVAWDDVSREADRERAAGARL